MAVLREPPSGENAAAVVILNGLARAARNLRRLGADGNPVRYQLGAYDSMQNERAIYRQFGWHRRSLKLLPLCLGAEAFLFVWENIQFYNYSQTNEQESRY